jgi:hypothetical protein
VLSNETRDATVSGTLYPIQTTPPREATARTSRSIPCAADLVSSLALLMRS